MKGQILRSFRRRALRNQEPALAPRSEERNLPDGVGGDPSNIKVLENEGSHHLHLLYKKGRVDFLTLLASPECVKARRQTLKAGRNSTSSLPQL
ncbi:hypothetical protein EMIT048CA2_30039 [Pseudomonas chlororaphis]